MIQNKIGEIDAFNSWSTEYESLKEWKTFIENTQGYEKTQNIQPKRFEIRLSKT